MAEQLNGRRVAILAADGVERVELEQPRQALDQAAASTILLSIHDGEIAARNHDLDDAGTFAVDQHPSRVRCHARGTWQLLVTRHRGVRRLQ